MRFRQQQSGPPGMHAACGLSRTLHGPGRPSRACGSGIPRLSPPPPPPGLDPSSDNPPDRSALINDKCFAAFMSANCPFGTQAGQLLRLPYSGHASVDWSSPSVHPLGPSRFKKTGVALGRPAVSPTADDYAQKTCNIFV